MIDHTGIGVANVARSGAFYDAAPRALGLPRVMQLPENDGSDGVGYGVDYPVFWIDRFHAAGLLAWRNPRSRTRCGSRRTLVRPIEIGSVKIVPAGKAHQREQAVVAGGGLAVF